MHHSQKALQTNAGLEKRPRNQHELQEKLKQQHADPQGHLQREVKEQVEGRAAEEDLGHGQVESEDLGGHGSPRRDEPKNVDVGRQAHHHIDGQDSLYSINEESRIKS